MFGKKKNLSEKELKIQEQNMKVQEESWAREKDLLERQYKMQEERKNLKPKGKITTTKWIVLFLFLNCTAIEIFTGWATYESLIISQQIGTYADFSPLVALIGAVVGEVMGFAVYAAKSTKENTAGGIVYDQAMQAAQSMIKAETEPGGVEDPEAAG